MIEIRDIVFDYPGKRALFGVTATVARGSAVALVGPNGAGKTTLLRCLVGLERPSAGTVHMDGIDLHRHPEACRRRIGYLSENFGVYETLSVRRCLTYAARAMGMPPRTQRAAVEAAAERLEIAARMGERAGALSRGLRQRLAIAQAIVHGPDLLVLDEPASGLDPESRHALAEMLRALAAGGVTMIVSSHILAELEAYCTEMLVIRDGMLTAAGGRLDAAAGRRLRLALAATDTRLADVLAGCEGVAAIEADGAEATFLFTGDRGAQAALLRRLVEAGLPVAALGEQTRALAEAYLSGAADGAEWGAE